MVFCVRCGAPDLCLLSYFYAYELSIKSHVLAHIFSVADPDGVRTGFV